MKGMLAQLTLAPAGLLWIPVTRLLRCASLQDAEIKTSLDHVDQSWGRREVRDREDGKTLPNPHARSP
jgi:hypothetical protein